MLDLRRAGNAGVGHQKLIPHSEELTEIVWLYRARWPICSVPKLPIPLRRKAKTTRFSFRRPTLKLENCAVTAQQSQACPSVIVELISELSPRPGRFWKSKKNDAPPKNPRSRLPRNTAGLHCEPRTVPASKPRGSASSGATSTARV